MKILEKILIIIITILGFIPLIVFCGEAIKQAINETEYLAAIILTILTLSLAIMGAIIVYLTVQKEE